MANAMYDKGVRKERALVNGSRERGLIAFRSAGSHSPIDVCIINIDRALVEFVQCKPNSWTPLQKQRLENENKRLNGLFNVVFRVL